MQYDAIEVHQKLKKEFPFVEFILEETQFKKFGRGLYHFRIKTFRGQDFDPPVKTSIFLEKNEQINDVQYNVIRVKMWESFVQQKNLGVI